MVIKKIYAYIIAAVIIFPVWTGDIFAAEEVWPVNLGTFRCPVSPKENEKIAIFKIIRPNGDEFRNNGNDNEHFSVSTKHPKENYGDFFCVTVSKDATSATWNQLVAGVDNKGAKEIVLQKWYDDDVDRQFKPTSNQLGVWGRLETAGDADDITYQLKQHEATTMLGTNEAVNLRQRYYLYGLEDSPEEVFIYFMKIAQSGDYPPTNTTCQSNHGASKDQCNADVACLWWTAGAKCISKTDSSTKCSDLDPDTCNVVSHCKKDPANSSVCTDKMVVTSQAVEDIIASTYKKPDGYTGPLPDCAWNGSCRKIEDLVELGVNVATWLFSVVAGLAFVFFVYGGITMIMSFGNAEKVTKGKQILVAATVGLIITFSAYALIGFVVKAIGIQSNLLPF